MGFFRAKNEIPSDHADAWLAAEGCPRDVIRHSDPRTRDRWIDRWGEIRRIIFERHLSTLEVQAQAQLRNGTHPSQSWSKAREAEPFAEAFAEILARRGYDGDVSVGCYHADRLILSVELPRELSQEELWRLPAYFHGFEVKYHWKPKSASEDRRHSEASTSQPD